MGKQRLNKSFVVVKRSTINWPLLRWFFRKKTMRIHRPVNNCDQRDGIKFLRPRQMHVCCIFITQCSFTSCQCRTDPISICHKRCYNSNRFETRTKLLVSKLHVHCVADRFVRTPDFKTIFLVVSRRALNTPPSPFFLLLLNVWAYNSNEFNNGQLKRYLNGDLRLQPTCDYAADLLFCTTFMRIVFVCVCVCARVRINHRFFESKNHFLTLIIVVFFHEANYRKASGTDVCLYVCVIHFSCCFAHFYTPVNCCLMNYLSS